jgi:hypothetical protein
MAGELFLDYLQGLSNLPELIWRFPWKGRSLEEELAQVTASLHACSLFPWSAQFLPRPEEKKRLGMLVIYSKGEVAGG